MEKVCFKCQRALPLADFYRHPRMADGHLNKCKACTKSDTRTNYAGNREHYHAYDRTRALRPDRVAARKAYQRTHPEVVGRVQRASNARYPERRAARVTLGNAVRDRKVTPAPRCYVCCQAKSLHGHHEDYAHPLWVAWLCSTCHRLVHKGVVTLGREHIARRPT